MQAEYVTDTPYTWEFFPEFGPLNLAYVAMLNGIAPVDVRAPFRVLELGCGNGVSLATYAACFPAAELHGVDLNPNHVEYARRLADASGLANVTFHEASFADFQSAEVGEFDAIVLHGVYSWVAPEVRRQIREILRRRLRPGGFAYVSYNAMPGAAPALPLRQVMLAYTQGRELPTLERVQLGLRYLSYLRDHDAGFFQHNELARRELDRLLASDPRYVAHEYFHRHWTCFAFEEVLGELAECELAFAGSVPIVMNIRELSIPERFREILQTAPNRIVYETHKSFVLNEIFRRDLYVKRPVRALDPDLHRAWDEQRFGSFVARDDLRAELPLPAGTVHYKSPIYAALGDALLERSATFGELCAMPELAPYRPIEILSSLHFLCAGGQFGPLQTPLRERTHAGGRFRLAPAFNRALLADRLLADGRAYLASPVAGTGVRVDLLQGLALLALDQAAESDPARALEDWAFGFLKRHGHVLRVGDEALPEHRQRALLEEHFAPFLDRSLGRLLAFGVLEPI